MLYIKTFLILYEEHGEEIMWSGLIGACPYPQESYTEFDASFDYERHIKMIYATYLGGVSVHAPQEINRDETDDNESTED